MTKLEIILNALSTAVTPGITTKDLDNLAETLYKNNGVAPAFKGYKPANFGGEEGFPASICVSIDNEVIHGIPSETRKIEEGQVVKIDLGTHESVADAEGNAVDYYDDGATTVLVGHCSATARKLVKATREALEAGVAAAVPGNTTHDIARVVSEVAKNYELHVVHGYGGHGIGAQLHMEPHIANEVDNSTAVSLITGQRLAIEPMLATNHGSTYVGKDGWTVKLHRGGLSAHFERTITVG
jgi:methionyl aminopeptidase